MRIILLRHGMTEANEKHQYCGSTDLALSEGGRKALVELRSHTNYPSAEGFDIVTSGMLRTKETLELLYGISDARVEPAFREIDFGAFECHTYKQLEHDPIYRAWAGDATGETAPPNGESAAHFAKRVIAAFEAISNDTLLVCHGGVIARIMAHVFPEEEKNMYEWQSSFGCGYLLNLTADEKKYSVIVPEE